MPTSLPIAALLFSGLKEELLFIILLFLMIIFFSFLKVAYAYVGLFTAIVGYVVRRKTESGKVDASGKLAGTQFKTMIHGPLAIFLIVGGFTVTIYDIWRNGPAAYAEAFSVSKHNIEEAAKAAKDNKTLDPDQILRGMIKAQWAPSFERPQKKLSGLLSGTRAFEDRQPPNDFEKRTCRKLLEIIESIDSPETLGRAYVDTNFIEIYVLRIGAKTNKLSMSHHEELFVASFQILEAINDIRDDLKGKGLAVSVEEDSKKYRDRTDKIKRDLGIQ